MSGADVRRERKTYCNLQEEDVCSYSATVPCCGNSIKGQVRAGVVHISWSLHAHSSTRPASSACLENPIDPCWFYLT